MIHEVNTRTFFPLERTLHRRWVGKTSRETPEHFRLDETSLFFALPVDGVAIDYLQAHVLPGIGFQVSKFNWRPHVSEGDKIDYYIDIVEITEHSSERWHVRDFYLDIVVVEGKHAEVLDTDEYLAAVQAGFLTHKEAAFALTKTHALLNALAKHGYSLEAYLNAQGTTLTWLEDD